MVKTVRAKGMIRDGGEELCRDLSSRHGGWITKKEVLAQSWRVTSSKPGTLTKIMRNWRDELKSTHHMRILTSKYGATHQRTKSMFGSQLRSWTYVAMVCGWCFFRYGGLHHNQQNEADLQQYRWASVLAYRSRIDWFQIVGYPPNL